MFLKSLGLKPLQGGVSLFTSPATNMYLTAMRAPTMMGYIQTMNFSSRFGHQIRNEEWFRADINAFSNKSQKGLFHGKTHHHKFKVCFSDKRHRYTQKPNVQRKKYYSDILDMTIRLPVTAHAMKNIVKAGSFDNYILNTKAEKMNSKMGNYLRNLMKQKQANPDFLIPYIPFSATQRYRLRRRTRAVLKLPSVYVPLHIRQNEDVTRYHGKDPSEMTREQIGTLEKAFRDPDAFQNADKEWKKKQPHYIEVRKEMLALQPTRHKIIKQYWERNRKSEVGREWILKMAEESEAFPKWILEDDYVYFRDAIPEINEDLAMFDAQKKQAIIDKQKVALGSIQLRIGRKAIDFNPFEHKQEHKKETIKEARKIYKP